ncbi:hypothetical protein OG394_14560 [Kribbella sp. NBC_01245]|uniref:hypothetical protein n=1 Tax=Kribbella sp. NBC_01245 TaxID=2903578 RepID=UPI002E2A1521|nr:hypothetical protein [Kribbella sp. NBC_01245]
MSTTMHPAAEVPAAPKRATATPSLDLFARGGDNALWHRWWAAGVGWTCWQSLRGELGDGAGAASHDPGIVHVVALGIDGRIKNRAFVNSGGITGGWSNWSQLGNQQFLASPAAASWGSDHFEVFATGTDKRIWHNWYRFGGGGWSGWYAFAADTKLFKYAPAAASFDAQKLNVFGLGEDGRIWERAHLGNGQWSAWRAMGDDLFDSAPAATSWGKGHLEAFARSADGRIWHNWYRFTAGAWSGWYVFDGPQRFKESPAAASHAPETLNLFALGTDDRMWQRYHLGGGSWSAWAPMGDDLFTSSPAAASWSI